MNVGWRRGWMILLRERLLSSFSRECGNCRWQSDNVQTFCERRGVGVSALAALVETSD